MKYTYGIIFNKLCLALLFGILLGITSVQAQDVEVYRTQGSATKVKPNLLFVLDESSSMSRKDGDSTTRTQELQDALEAIFADPADGGLEDVNAAFMGYSKRQYGGRRVITTGSNTGFFDVDKNRGTLVSRIDDIYHISGTVTVQAMAAAVDWFAGGFTDDDGDGYYDGCYNDRGNCPKGTGVGNDVSVLTPVDSDLYCAQNSIILLTDGAPYSDQPSSDPRLDDRHPYQSIGYRYKGEYCTNPDPSGFSMSRAGCTGDIAEWAFNNDLFPSIRETQNIITHTIGFHTGSTAKRYLEDIAQRGGGKYYPSSDTASLVAAFNAISNEAKSSVTYTFNAPLVPFNATNTAVSGDFIYVPVFEPGVTAFWKGNLKKYTLSISGLGITLESAPGGGDVLSPKSLFLDSAKSYWSTNVDGSESLAGGAVSKFYGTRNLYTYVTGSTSTLLASDDQNRVEAGNALITHAMLGLPTPAKIGDTGDPANIERKDILEWVSWTDDANAHEGEMGAPIHAQPEVVDVYGAGNDVILMPTSEGVLEAIDARTGAELWAFMPEELLKNIGELKLNAGRTEPIYGLDGPMTVYEINGKTMVVVGMRRGGRNYYALDISNRLNPKFAWKIIGGVTPNFVNLGQTWSKPLALRMEIAGAPTNGPVLVFGGGYDAAKQDKAAARVDDTLGRGVYVVNAETGAWITTYAPSGNLNSIAADILPVDINANGIIDRIYAADVGGRIIRIDTPDNDFLSTTVTSGVIADVNVGNSVYHQFYNTPEVGYFNRGGAQFLTILIGSGARPDPLSKIVTDSFYMIKDPNIWRAPISYDVITRANLHDATANLVQVGDADDRSNQLAALSVSNGWFIDMPAGAGEKIFSKASLYDFSVLFTTYSGTRANDSDVCSAGTTEGEAKFWAVNMLTGAAVFSQLGGDSATLDTADRSKSLNIPGMPPSPTLLFPAQTKGGLGRVVIALVGLQEVTRWPDRFHAIYWEEVTSGGYTTTPPVTPPGN